MAKIAVAQMLPDPEDLKANLKQARALIKRAAKKGAQVVVLPEMAITGQDDEGRPAPNPIPGPATDELAQAARKANAWVIAGLPEANPEGKPFNSAVAINPDGEIADVYRKVFLYRCENDGYQPGNRACVLDLGFCRAGLTICYDYIFPEYIRKLAVAGAQLLLHPTAWQTNDVCRSWNYPARKVYRAQCRVRALENNIFVASANQADSCDDRGKLHMLGRSSIIAPWGEVLAEVRKGEGVAVADLDFAMIEGWSEEAAPYLKDYMEKTIPDL